MFVAVFVAALMLGPALRLGDHDLSPTDSASAQKPERVFRMGWAGFAGTVKTLNPFTYTMGQEYALIWPCYSFLLGNNENNEMVGDLATKWTVSPDGLTWHFWITHNASFYNKKTPGTQVPLTVDDVMFTYWLVQNNSGAVMNYYFPDLPGLGRLIESMQKINNYEMTFTLRASFAPFQSALSSVPIVPKYIWDGKLWNWANFDHTYSPCIGSGFMYYGADDLKSISTVGQAELFANPTWFQTLEYGIQSHVYKYTIKDETDATAIADYNAGVIDVINSPTAAQFFDPSFPGANGQKFATSQGFVMYVSINQLSLQDRADYGIGGPGSYNSQVCLDPTVAWAIKMIVNKTSIVENDFLGGGSPADTLMPESSPWVYHYGSTPGETPIPNNGDPAGARQMLIDAGWHYNTAGLDLTGTPALYTTTPLCKVGGTEELSFRIYCPDNHDFFDGACRRMVITGDQAGINVIYGGPSPYNTAYQIWKTGDYELLVWDWWFSPPPTEPSLDVAEIYTSMAIGGDSDCNYHNATYDALYYESLLESDPVARKVMIDELQRMAYLYAGCWPIAYADVLYGIHTVGPPLNALGQKWHNWGDWETYYPLCADSGYVWLFARIYPEDNPSPQITVFEPYYETNTTLTVPFNATAQDTDSLLYRWNFGDGTNTSWSTSPEAPHVYTRDGYYNAYFMVKEASPSTDGFMSHAMAKIKVIDTSNNAPTGLSFTIEPSDPDQGTLVYLNGTATDTDTPLIYSWNFGDGSLGGGQNVIHQFSAGTGLYTVHMYVDDGHLGQVSRPVQTTGGVLVTANDPPKITVPAYPNVPYGENYNFVVTASDKNTRDHLKFTWDWGDGTMDVTTTASCYHQYKWVRSFTLVVHADDQTGLPGHNVSGTSTVTVYRGYNHAPVLTLFTVSNTIPTNEQVVTFYANATDADGDAVQFNFTFGDGNYSVVTQTLSNTTMSVDYVYLTPGEYFPSVTYTDFVASPITAYSYNYGWWMTVSRANFTLNLLAGWNFVSVPRIGEGYTANTLGLATGDEVVGYDPETQTYDKLFVIGWPSGLDFAIEGSTGYWVYSATAKPLHLFGAVATSLQSRAITVPSGGGWAIVSFSTLSTTMHASDVPGMYTGGSVTEVVYYDQSTGYSFYIPGMPFPDFLLVPGQAYWVWCTATGSLSYLP